MGELNITASTIISFAEGLEETSSRFYEKLAEKYAEGKEIFLSFAKEGKENKVLLRRTYQETISDALEACFIKGLDLNDYMVETELTEDTEYLDALKMGIELEEKATKFYYKIAEYSSSLLATLPRAFKKVAEKRNGRKTKLKLLHARSP